MALTADCGTTSQRSTDYGSIQCSSSIGDAFAQASQFSVFAGSNLTSLGSVTATASIVDEVTLTFFGGIGDSFYLPCLEATAGRGSAFGSLGIYGFSIAGPGNTGFSCAGEDASRATRFTFGVPQLLDLHLSAFASSMSLVHPSSGASIDLAGFMIFDLSGQPLTGVTHTLVGTLATIPEPRNLIAVGMLLLSLGGLAVGFPAHR